MGIAIDTTLVPTEDIGARPSHRLAFGDSLRPLRARRAALGSGCAGCRNEGARASESGFAPDGAAVVSEGNVQPTVQSEFLGQFTAGLQAVWKLFDGGGTAARIAAASAGIAHAQAAYDGSRTALELRFARPTRV